MQPIAEQMAQLEATIAVVNAQRATLGDALVDASLGPLRAQLAALHAQAASSAPLHSQLNHLSRADLIRLFATEPDLAYIFKHALTQESAYESMLLADR